MKKVRVTLEVIGDASDIAGLVAAIAEAIAMDQAGEGVVIDKEEEVVGVLTIEETSGQRPEDLN